jgi:hypothetical protein
MTRRKLITALASSAVAVVATLVFALAAGAASGQESFKGVIVATGTSGERTVVSSVVIARGAFNGVGRIVERDNLPSDPGNVERDDIVFAGGSIHLLSTVIDVVASLDPRSCVFSLTIQQTNEIQGGTGVFTHASGTGTATVKARGVTARDAAGACSEDPAALLDIDTLSSNGTLSF